MAGDGREGLTLVAHMLDLLELDNCQERKDPLILLCLDGRQLLSEALTVSFAQDFQRIDSIVVVILVAVFQACEPYPGKGPCSVNLVSRERN